MSTHVTPTKAQIQLFNDLRNIIHYPPTHDAIEKGVALIADYEALRFAEWERQILQLETELAASSRKLGFAIGALDCLRFQVTDPSLVSRIDAIIAKLEEPQP